jgi:hypothetical protein
MRSASILWLFILLSAVACADDLVTRDGKVYHDYKVLGHDAGFITIMYSDGGGKIPLSELPDDLQQKYGYNKVQADAFVQASIAQDRQDRQAVANEERRHQQQMAANAHAQNSVAPPPAPGLVQAVPPPLSPSPANSLPAHSGGSEAPTSGAPAPLSPDDIDSIEGQISDLSADIALMKSESVPREPHLDQTPYTDKINAESVQISQLKQRLATDNMLIGKSIPSMSQEEIDAAYSRIAALRKDVISLRADSPSAPGSVGKIAQDYTEDDRLEQRLNLDYAVAPRLHFPKDQVEAIKVQIAALVDDSNRLKKQMNVTVFDISDRSSEPLPWKRGGYDDMLIDDLVKLEELRAEISRQ